MNLRTSAILTLILTLTTLLLGDITQEILNTPKGVEALSLFVTMIVAAIIISDYFLRVKYHEYKDNYIMFYSWKHLVDYTTTHDIKVENVSKEVLDEIVKTIHADTYFDKSYIRKGLYVYYFTLSEKRPDRLDDEIKYANPKPGSVTKILRLFS